MCSYFLRSMFPLSCLAAASLVAAEPYPDTRQEAVVDEYHGVKVADPYRWLEDDRSPETQAWVAAQNRVTNAFLEKIPERQAIRDRLEKLWNYERFSVPQRESGRYFFRRNSGLQNQSVLYVADALDAEPRVLLDPNTLSADGTTALADYRVSDDGSLLAYGLAKAGSDWTEWRVREVATGRDREDRVEWVKFSSAAWLKDATRLFLQPLRCATGGCGFHGRKRVSQTLLSSARHTAERRPAGL